MLRVSPVRFPAYYEPDETYKNAQHILFGGYEDGSYMNPYAEMVKGYREESNTMMMAQIELKQDFGKWVKGLTGRLLGNTTRTSAFDLSRSYNPFYYEVSRYDRITDEYLLTELNPDGGTEYLNYSPGYKTVSSSFYAEGSVAYNRTFGKHGVSGMLVGIMIHDILLNLILGIMALKNSTEDTAGDFFPRSGWDGLFPMSLSGKMQVSVP
jgi:hypothetical protein